MAVQAQRPPIGGRARMRALIGSIVTRPVRTTRGKPCARSEHAASVVRSADAHPLSLAKDGDLRDALLWRRERQRRARERQLVDALWRRRRRHSGLEPDRLRLLGWRLGE